MTPPHIFPAESIMGIIPSRPTHAIAGRLIRNSSAYTLIAARHDDGATQDGAGATMWWGWCYTTWGWCYEGNGGARET